MTTTIEPLKKPVILNQALKNGPQLMLGGTKMLKNWTEMIIQVLKLAKIFFGAGIQIYFDFRPFSDL